MDEHRLRVLGRVQRALHLQIGCLHACTQSLVTAPAERRTCSRCSQHTSHMVLCTPIRQLKEHKWLSTAQRAGARQRYCTCCSSAFFRRNISLTSPCTSTTCRGFRASMNCDVCGKSACAENEIASTLIFSGTCAGPACLFMLCLCAVCASLFRSWACQRLKLAKAAGWAPATPQGAQACVPVVLHTRKFAGKQLQAADSSATQHWPSICLGQAAPWNRGVCVRGRARPAPRVPGCPAPRSRTAAGRCAHPRTRRQTGPARHRPASSKRRVSELVVSSAGYASLRNQLQCARCNCCMT